MTIKHIVQQYYDGIAQKNDTWHNVLAENILFEDAGLSIYHKGKESFIESLNKFLRVVEKVTVKEVLAEENRACAIVNYDLNTPKGTIFNLDIVELWKEENGKFTSLTIFFDTALFKLQMGR